MTAHDNRRQRMIPAEIQASMTNTPKKTRVMTAISEVKASHQFQA